MQTADPNPQSIPNNPDHNCQNGNAKPKVIQPGSKKETNTNSATTIWAATVTVNAMASLEASLLSKNQPVTVGTSI